MQNSKLALETIQKQAKATKKLTIFFYKQKISTDKGPMKSTRLQLKLCNHWLTTIEENRISSMLEKKLVSIKLYRKLKESRNSKKRKKYKCKKRKKKALLLIIKIFPPGILSLTN
jgi:hypothetical protein